ncbi:MAG: efflux RND transporter permease subunit [Pseudomonadales bacterium]|nr:efflux RND transporter permease subunit [Pseudomonadales bacterium]
MNIAEYAVKNVVSTWLLVIIFLGGGLLAYEKMGKLEDPDFTIKEAKIITLYPGATPQQVQEEVTYHIEDAMQQLGQLKRLKMTISSEGRSEVTIQLKDKYSADKMPNIYDEVRRKLADMQHKLPPGAMAPQVVDDFGDVFGIYWALTGDGYSYRDLKDVAEELKKQLVLVPGVRKVNIGGAIDEEVIVEISRARMAELGIDLQVINNVLQSQNLVVESGQIRVENDYITINPTGEFTSVQEISELLISSEDKRFIRLKDIADVRRVYNEVPTQLIYQDGKPAITLAISSMKGENVIAVGQAMQDRLDDLQDIIPVGVEISKIYDQPGEVDKSVSGFVLSVIQALVIVVIVLLLFMGAKVGFIIGAVLLITVAGTLWIMELFGIELQRISLGALIIALGMLVDNAIVVAEGMMIRIQRGEDKIKAAIEVVGKTNSALFGGTLIGILAFSGIGLAQSNTGEFARSLFYVLLISLTLSWITAITVTPMLCALLLKANPDVSDEDAYSGKVFQAFRSVVKTAIQFRWITIAAAVVLFIAGVIGYGSVKQAFFPNASTPIFFVDIWEVEGTDIRQTRDDALKLDQFIRSMDTVQQTTLSVGAGHTRFSLVYSPESPFTSYAQFIVRAHDVADIAEIKKQISEYMRTELPNTEPKIKTLRIGPGRDSKIEARFTGPDAAVLRQLSEQAKVMMNQDAEAVEVRDDWRHPVKKIRPVFNERVARQLGITRQELASALQSASDGVTVGVYRDGIRLLPIKVRSPDVERRDVASLQDVQVWSPVLGKSVPIGQVVERFETVYENAMIRSRNRGWTIIASCNPSGELADALFNRLRAQIETIELPPGYALSWGGEYEDSSEAQEALFQALPGGFLLMMIVTILLFGRVRQPLMIWLIVPLAIIGITFGLLLVDGAFDFMALLGSLALIGLMIKNAIVLVEEIDMQIEEGKEALTAILDATVSRMRPVMMAASTTILGLIPLLSDVFFVNMSITMMFGLGVATVLTLVLLPTVYATLFSIKYRDDA